MRKPNGQTIFLTAAIVFALAMLGGWLVWHRDGNASAQAAPRKIPFNGERAYRHLVEICRLGARVSGTQGMARQQKLLAAHFRALGARVSWQRFSARHPETGQPVAMANMIVQWHPTARERILFCAHYDTRPFPDSDPDRRRRRDLFLGANDGASGVAVLCELGRHMANLESRYGVDFVLFDGEELVYDAQRDPYFRGSEHFARMYKSAPPAYRYRWGVLLDMVGDRELQLYYEKNSYGWRDTRPLVLDIWKTAKRLGVKEFIPRTRHRVNDDHLALRNVAGIPTCDIIDFDYPRPGRLNYWHTTADNPANCSADSLAKVGWVLLEWLKQAE